MRLEIAVRKSLGAFRLDVALETDDGRVGLFGPSGSGKSTVVGVLAGLIAPDEGRIAFEGEPLFDRRAGIDVPPERRRIAVVFQRPNLFPHLDVKGNLLYGKNRRRGEGRPIPLDPVVEVLELGSLLDRRVRRLSGGEQQRVGLGRALLSGPRMILLDEPLSGLDDPLKYRILPYLRRTFEAFEVPFLFISHSVMEMRLLSRTVFIMENGRVVGETGPEALAVRRMGAGGGPFINLLRLSGPRRRDGLAVYRWGDADLAIASDGGSREKVFELSADNILLMRDHPGGISARNLFPCRVERLHDLGSRTGVELSCGKERLIAAVMRETAPELGIFPGVSIYAAIKASAFREVC